MNFILDSYFDSCSKHCILQMNEAKNGEDEINNIGNKNKKT